MRWMALTVRDHKYLWQGQVPRDLGQAVVASLSADPPTIEALRLALQRFVPGPRCQELFQNLRYRKLGQPAATGEAQCAIDLSDRLLLTSWDQANQPISVSVLAREDGKDTAASYDLHPDWTLTTDFRIWQRKAPRGIPSVAQDIQRRIYGTDLLRYLLRACQPGALKEAGWTGRPLRIGDDREANAEVLALIEHVQRGWYRSPSGVQSLSIRGLLQRDCVHVQRDLISRIEQWIATDECPPGMMSQGALAPAVGPGRHEVILYHGLLSFLIHQLFLSNLPYHGREFNRSLRLMARARDWWYSEPSPILSGRTPEEIIDFERRRVPIQIADEHQMADHDCPLCRLQAADNPGPQFWEIDDLLITVPYPRFWCGTDDTFDTTPESEDFEGWELCDESEPMSWQRHQMYKDLEAPSGQVRIVTWSLPPRLGNDDPAPLDDDFTSSAHSAEAGPWKHTFVNAPPEPVPHEFRVYYLAGYLGEIIEDLKDEEVHRSQIDELNRHFDNLIEAVRSAPHLLQSVIERLIQLLADLPDRPEALGTKIDCMIDQLEAMANVCVP